MTKTLPGLGLIAAVVAVAFQIHNFQPAISPLALCVAFGFIIANFASWPAVAAAGTAFSSKKLMRIGVALLGAQVSVVSLQAIGVGRYHSDFGCGPHNLWNRRSFKTI